MPYTPSARLHVVVVLVSILAILGAGAPRQGAQGHRLTSVEQNVDVADWRITSREVGVAAGIPWSVRKHRLHGGRQDGVDLIVLDNGRMTITLVPTRGMGILHVVMDDLRLGWSSPVREVVHPKYVDLQARGGLGWLEGFNEWMVRCGLEWAGHPGRDRFVNNVGEQAEMDLTLHGKVANIPASEVEVVIDREPRPRIRVRGRVDERMFYGPKLELWTEVSTEPGATTFRIEDVLTNRGAFDQEFQVIYHANYGPPLLAAGARFAAPVRRVTPFNAHAARGVEQYAELRTADQGIHRAGVQPVPARRCRRAQPGDAAERGGRPRRVDGLPGGAAPLRDALEEPERVRGGVRHRAGAGHRLSVYPAPRARGGPRPEAEARGIAPVRR